MPNVSLIPQYYNENVRRNPSMHGVNLAANKTKAVAWFVSNCGARNGRLAYAKELQKYIQVRTGCPITSWARLG